MKIRCENNSIRFRLRKSELSQLRAGDSVRTEVFFQTGLGFSWELWIDTAAETARATGYGSHVAVALPLEMAMQWIDSEQVGIEFFQPIDRDQRLRVLIEKDFPCKDRPGEDKSDFFVELAAEKPALC